MRMTKYRLESFQLYDFSGMEAHLTKMARRGWALEKVGALFWKYRRIAPQELQFSVTYYPDASVYDPGPTDSQRRLYDICEEMGWTFVGEWWQMQIFSRPVTIAAGDGGMVSEAVALETDPKVKLTNIERTMRRSGGAGNLVTLMMIPVFFLMMYMKKSTMERLTDAYTMFALAEYVILAIYALTNLAFYSLWHKKAKLAADQGEDLPPVGGGYRQVGRFVLILAFVAIFFWLKYFGSTMYYVVCGLVLGICLFSVVVAEGVRNGMKRKGASRKKNQRATLITIVAISLAATTAMTSVLIFGVVHHWFREGSQPTEYTTYAKNGSSWTWDVYHDELPLEVEDLMDTDYEHYSKERQKDQRSMLARHVVFRQNGFPDGEDPAELGYEILDTKLFYEECLGDMMKTETRFNDDRKFRTDGMEELESMWGAECVYQLHRSDGPRQLYIISWTKEQGGKDRIVKVEFSWEPTVEQLKLAGERLLAAEL